MKKLENNILIEKNNNVVKERFYYFDYLRIVCSFCVILNHVSAFYYSKFSIYSYKWKISYFYNGISRFSIPNFFMISGTIFLNKNLTFKILITKYIKRVFEHYLIWSTIYSFTNSYKLDFTSRIFQIIRGHYHLWYLLSIMGLYIIVPFIKEIIKNNNTLTNLLYFNFICIFIIPNYIHAFSFHSYKILKLLNDRITELNINTLSINNFYFIFGYFLNLKRKIKKQILIIIHSVGLIGLFFTTKTSYELSSIKKIKITHNDPRYLNIFFYSISIFILFKTHFNSNKKIIQKLAKYTFGIYLIHPFVIDNIIKKLKLFYSDFNFLFLIPALSIFIFLMSFVICFILNSIPILGNHLI